MEKIGSAAWRLFALDSFSSGRRLARCSTTSLTVTLASLSADAIHAWTENKVLFVYEYDGATQVLTIPRNPTPADVRLPGAI